MSRYYNVEIFKPGSTAVFKQYTSFPLVGAKNQTDPGALNLVIDAYEYAFAQPQGLCSMQIWGVALADISQASNLDGCTVNIYAGFQKGLPLNNPNQAGLIISGVIFQAFGNWIGTDMTLDLVIAPQGALAAQNSNVSFSWKAGTSLSAAIAATMQAGLKGVKQTVNINPNLILAHDESGYYPSLVGFAQMLKGITQDIIGGTYPGVDVAMTPNGILVYDGSNQANPTTLAFQDLIGQPTWIDPGTIQFVCPMRADLHVADFVKMPQGLLGVPGAVVTTSASQPQARQSSVFNGSFGIVSVHHMGNYRQPDGTSWVTVFNANPRAA